MALTVNRNLSCSHLKMYGGLYRDKFQRVDCIQIHTKDKIYLTYPRDNVCKKQILQANKIESFKII